MKRFLVSSILVIFTTEVKKNIGKILTAEHREKISKKHIGKRKGPMTNEHRLNLGKSLRQYHDIRRKTKK